MNLSAKDILKRLGAGEPIANVCTAAAITREQFDVWWQAECATRVPNRQGQQRVSVSYRVELVRDAWGVAHIFAQNDTDLFFGYGYVQAQDRLWQLDYLRRKGLGRLAEILGASALNLDLLARTIGFNRIAAQVVATLPTETRQWLEAFSHGINAAMAESHQQLSIEFALLDYEPEPWTPLDSIASWVEFQWYGTGRFPVIIIPEVAKRVLGDERLYQAFLAAEANDECIVPREFYPSNTLSHTAQPVGETIGDPTEGVGSNNWVVAGQHTPTGLPLLASDPHVPFCATSRWYEVHLCGGSFNVAGAGFVGVPAIRFGRNEHVAWGVTNNICSQRDLYQERTDPSHPDCFLFAGQWEKARTLTEIIHVKDSEPIQQQVRFSRHGPLVDEILPEIARGTGPVSLRWMGAIFSHAPDKPSDELSCALASNRAHSGAEFREAFRYWRVPTWNLVFADVDGHIGYQ